MKKEIFYQFAKPGVTKLSTMHSEVKRCTAKCLAGMETCLAKELELLGFNRIIERRRAVEFESDLNGLMKANLWSRHGLSFLFPVADFKIKNKDDLYRAAFEVEWEKWFEPHLSFSMQHTVFSDLFANTTFPALVVKDAIVDRFRKFSGKRPNVNREHPDVQIHLYLSADHVVLSFNTSGNPLYMRGYRNMTFPAPLNECLAAGLIGLSEWDGKTTLINPMCGSGTLAIEAAMMAANVPANILRKEYGFMNLKTFDVKAWDNLLQEAEREKLSQPKVRIAASDVSHRALSIVRNSLNLLGLEDWVEIVKMDITKPKVDTENGLIIINPPYGERIDEGDVMKLYGDIGRTLKFSYQGHSAWLISSNIEAIHQIGLKPFKKYTVFNGKLECKYLGYQLY